MKLKNIAFFALLAVMASALVSCNDFLDKDPSKSTDKTIRTAAQLDALLATYGNFFQENDQMLRASDDSAMTTPIQDNRNSKFSVEELNIGLWGDECTLEYNIVWITEYDKVFMANLVLNNLDKVSGDPTLKANLKAEAHLLRAYSLFQLAVGYTLYYDGTNGGELGLPLKKTTSFEESIVRASLADTWAFIDADVQEALKITAPFVVGGKRHMWRGTTVSAHAFAARYYLYRGDLANAQTQAEAVLKEYSGLKDYNVSMKFSTETADTEFTINTSTVPETVIVQYPYPVQSDIFPDFFEWEDVLYPRVSYARDGWYPPSKELLDTYSVDVPGGNPKNDLRYEYFVVEDFSLRSSKQDPAFRYPGYYQFSEYHLISGPTVPEMILIKAESQARQGKWQDAMSTMDVLRKARIATAVYTKLEATSQADAVKKILQERRREMALVIRWYDLKRLNSNNDTSDDVTVTRTFYPYNKSSILDKEPVKTYTLTPKSRHYAQPIPNIEIRKAKGELQQNTY